MSWSRGCYYQSSFVCLQLQLENYNLSSEENIWNAVIALSQLKLNVYLCFLYDNAILPYAVAIIWLYYVYLSFYYVLKPFSQVIQLCCICRVIFPYSKFTFDHFHLLCARTTFYLVECTFVLLKRHFKAVFILYYFQFAYFSLVHFSSVYFPFVRFSFAYLSFVYF